MKLFEIFNKIDPYTWTMLDKNMGEAEFTVGNLNYAVLMTKTTLRYETGSNWTIEFAQFTINDRNENIYRTDMTNTGHSFEVLSTVKAILIEWFSKHPADKISMSAATPTRKSLYTKLIKSAFPSWIVTIDGNEITARSPK